MRMRKLSEVTNRQGFRRYRGELLKDRAVPRPRALIGSTPPIMGGAASSARRAPPRPLLVFTRPLAFFAFAPCCLSICRTAGDRSGSVPRLLLVLVCAILVLTGWGPTTSEEGHVRRPA
jgi:hypothetical protein